MKTKSLLIFTFVILALFAVASVSAADTNDTVTAIDDQSDDLKEIETQDDIVANNATEEMLNANLNDNIVSSSDEDTLSDDEWGTFQELQDFINGHDSKAIILSKNYRYSESDTLQNGITISKSYEIYGENCIIDGQGTARLFNVEANDVVFSQMTFKNGAAMDGAAIYCPNNSNLRVQLCNFENCKATVNGGAIYVGGSGFIIDNNVDTKFSKCNANGEGAAIYLTSGATGASLHGTFKDCYSSEDQLYTSRKGCIHNETAYTDNGCSFSGTTLIEVKFSSSHLTTLYGVDDYLKVTLKLDNGTALSGVNVTVNLNNKTKNYTTDENGTIEIPVLGLDVDEYTATFDYVDDVVYTSASGSQKITIKQTNSSVTIKNIPDFNFNEDMIVDFTVANRTTVNAVITGDSRKILIENIAGNSVDLGSLPVGEYTINITNIETQNINGSSNSASFKVIKNELINTNITLDVIVDGLDAAFTVNVDPNATGLIEFNVDGKSGYFAPENGTAFYAVDLVPGDYNITVTYLGDDKFNSNSTSKAFTIDKIKTQLISSKVSVTYGNSKNVVVTLTDSKGNLLIGQSVSVKINGQTTTKTTDSKGQISVATSKSLAPKTYTATITFAGDDTYAKSTGSVKVAVSKDKSKISAKAKSYKKSKKTKKYTVTLKASSTSKAIKKVKVTLKVNKKTYSAKTNSKGKATFKITKLNKKGKFTAKVKFAGNSYYKAVSKNVKITVKK